MNCSLIDEQRINQGLLCRGMTCLKCNEFRQMNNEHKNKESCLSEMSSRIINLQKKLEAVTTEKNRFERLLKEFVFFEDNNAEWKSLSEKLEAVTAERDELIVKKDEHIKYGQMVTRENTDLRAKLEASEKHVDDLRKLRTEDGIVLGNVKLREYFQGKKLKIAVEALNDLKGLYLRMEVGNDFHGVGIVDNALEKIKELD